MQEYFSYVETLILIGRKGNEDTLNRLLLKTADKIRKVVIVDPKYEIVEDNLKELLSKPNIEKVVYEKSPKSATFASSEIFKAKE